nr:iron chelate uptake ABC transporter family permease subunit [Klebsiella pneumoniae]
MLTASFTGWQAECVPRPLAGCLAALAVVVTAVPVVLLLANQLNLLNVSDSTAHTLGVNLPRLRLIINMLVLLLVGACVSVAGPVAFIGLLVPHLARFWAGFDQRNDCR